MTPGCVGEGTVRSREMRVFTFYLLSFIQLKKEHCGCFLFCAYVGSLQFFVLLWTQGTLVIRGKNVIMKGPNRCGWPLGGHSAAPTCRPRPPSLTLGPASSGLQLPTLGRGGRWVREQAALFSSPLPPLACLSKPLTPGQQTRSAHINVTALATAPSLTPSVPPCPVPVARPPCLAGLQPSPFWPALSRAWECPSVSLTGTGSQYLAGYSMLKLQSQERHLRPSRRLSAIYLASEIKARSAGEHSTRRTETAEWGGRLAVIHEATCKSIAGCGGLRHVTSCASSDCNPSWGTFNISLSCASLSEMQMIMISFIQGFHQEQIP